jgi:hypothetical protein
LQRLFAAAERCQRHDQVDANGGVRGTELQRPFEIGRPLGKGANPAAQRAGITEQRNAGRVGRERQLRFAARAGEIAAAFKRGGTFEGGS